MVARTRCTIEGTIAGGVDIWTTSFYGGSSQGYSTSDLNDFAVNLDTAWQTYVWNNAPGGILNAFAPTVDYVRVTVRDINASGVTDRVASAGPLVPILGTAEGLSLPSECAEVVSLISDHAGGRGRGRMYLPALAASQLGTAGTIYVDAVNGIADQFEAFFENLNADVLMPGAVSVYSGVDDVLREVVQIKVGNIFDSQRRRRNSIIESYVTRAIG